MKERDVTDRIREIMYTYDLNIVDFSEKINVSRATVGGVLKYQTPPGSKMFYGIAAAFPDINMDWLFHGRGRMVSEKKPDLEGTVNDVLVRLSRIETAMRSKQLL